jgi:hypothetical protein
MLLMTYDFSRFSTSELYDFLAEITLRYNYILQHGGSQDEFERLSVCLKIIQAEIQKRKKDKGK